MPNALIKLLLVEDDPDDVLLLKDALATAKAVYFELAHVQNLQAALQHLNTQATDVILLDLSLPDVHGLLSVQRIHAATPHIPIVVLTGLDDEMLAVEAVQSGAQDYLVKGQADGRLLVRALRYAIERAETLQELHLSEESFRSAVSAMQEGLILIDTNHIMRVFNQSAERILGVPAEKMLGQKSTELNWCIIREDGSDFPVEEYLVHVSLRTGTPQSTTICGVHRPDGQLVWLSINAAPLFQPGHNKPYAAVTTFTDITERLRYEEQFKEQLLLLDETRHNLEIQQVALLEANEKLETLATTDGLTGLKNHRAFQEKLQEEFRRTTRYGSPLSLLMIDVDSFKAYNDAFGHPAGDIILQQVARILEDNVRDSDVVARYGGEEFIILLPNTDYPWANELAERLRIAIEKHPWQHRPITASFGISTMSPCTSSPGKSVMENSTALIAAADKAMYYSKQQGRNRVAHAQELESSM